MKNLFIKICGITNAKDAYLAVSFGANALGFMMYQKSPRYIPQQEVKEILKELPDEIVPVMVFVDPSPEYVDSCLNLSSKIIPQFHGSETQEFCSSFNRDFIKAIRVSKKEDVVAGFEKYPNSWMLLFDSYRKDKFGGTGTSFDWSYLINGDYKKAYIVAGGLNSNNVEKVLSLTSCAGLDISSGVESSPGKKDFVKMKKFINIARKFHV
tara:strand:- start:42 stop:671 length:630 start_codon:yes stop_codon:yes gene_type:complete